MVTFCRVFFCLIVVLILSVVIIFLIRFWNNYAYYPSFEVVSFVVHTFNITNSTNELTAHWEVDVSVGNSNRNVEISFEYIATSLVYKFALLESSFSAPFNVAGKRNAEFHVDFDIPNSNQRQIGGIVVNEMARDRRNGYNLVVDLRIEAIIVNKYSNGNQYKRKLDVLCEYLILKFKNSSSLPVWEGNTENYIQECSYDEYWWSDSSKMVHVTLAALI
ncbi:hypothetical protein HAX54_027455 [Datura stramonium]|uniref:Late embryogenesis abundant protein LEA-2 subgroup domain-containing protein n=1 Tax=Datura stramonium TaxID=4076 RepID=A0ABS8S8S8_DATST|nr:hypothetical protein [Datura stramonium]